MFGGWVLKCRENHRYFDECGGRHSDQLKTIMTWDNRGQLGQLIESTASKDVRHAYREVNMKVVIFDFFGVICRDLFEEWVRRNRLELSREKIRAQAVDIADIGAISFEEQCAELARIVQRDWTQVRDELLVLSEIDHGVIELAMQLADTGHKVAICSNAPNGLIDVILSRHQVEIPWICKVISGEVGVTKPSRGIFELLACRTRMPLEACVLIDDNVANIRAAQEMGITGIHFSAASALINQLRMELLLH